MFRVKALQHVVASPSTTHSQSVRHTTAAYAHVKALPCFAGSRFAAFATRPARAAPLERSPLRPRLWRFCRAQRRFLPDPRASQVVTFSRLTKGCCISPKIYEVKLEKVGLLTWDHAGSSFFKGLLGFCADDAPILGRNPPSSPPAPPAAAPRPASPPSPPPTTCSQGQKSLMLSPRHETQVNETKRDLAMWWMTWRALARSVVDDKASTICRFVSPPAQRTESQAPRTSPWRTSAGAPPPPPPPSACPNPPPSPPPQPRAKYRILATS